MDKKVLTTYEIAKYCHVSPRTIHQWIKEGKMEAYQTPGKHSRVKKEDFLAFLKKFRMPIPEELKDAHGRKKILIVDDEKDMVRMIRRLLISYDEYDVDFAYDGFEAGQKFSRFQPDLLILDIRMPKMDGETLCRHIRSHPENHRVKILVISGIPDEHKMEELLAAGADDFLQKPFDNKVLLNKVDLLLHDRTEKLFKTDRS